MSGRRLLLVLSGLFAWALLVFGLAGSAQRSPGVGAGAGADASTLYGNGPGHGHAEPVGGSTATPSTTGTPVPICPQVWAVVSSQNASGIRNELWGVGGVSDSDAWAVGLYQQQSGTSLPLIERWNGAQWNVAPGAPVTGTGELHALAVLASNNIWAVGTRNRNDSLVEHWDGASWTIVPSPNPGQEFNNPASISAVGPNDIWAAGVKGPGSSGTPLVFHWNGSAWTNVTLPTMPGVYSELYGVTALASNNVWAVGYYNANGGKFTLIIHWDGTAWSIVPSPNYGTSANSLLSVGGGAGATPNDVWAVGEIAYGVSALIEHWDGSAWTVTTTISNGSLRSVLPISANDVWAVGTRGESQTLSMHWDGASWSIIPSANPDPNGNAFKWAALTQSGGLWGVGYKGAPIEPYHQTLAELYNAPVPPCPPTATPTNTGTPPTATSMVPLTGTPPTSTPTNTPTNTVTGTPPTSTPTPCANAWSLLTPYPTPAAFQAAAFFNGQLYVFGGYNAPASVLSASYRYDPANNTWYALAPLPQGRSGARAVSDGTYIYILGGEDPNLNLTNTLWRYDPAANSYQTLAPFSVATAFHAAVYLAGKIYRIAGNGTASMEVYNIVSNSWSIASSYPLSIAGVMAVTDGTYIYTAGGTTRSVKTYRYDPFSDSWDDASIPDLPDPHEAGATGFLDGRMVVAGGFATTGVTNEVLNWTPGQNNWVTRAPLPNAGGGMGSAADGTNLYAVGGVVNIQFQDWNQRYYEFGCGTPTATVTGTPPTATPTQTSTPTVTGTPPTAIPSTATATPDCSTVDVHPTVIWPPGAFIYVTVPPGWTWEWEPITDLMRYNCTPQYPTGVSCSWSCTTFEPREGRAGIRVYDQFGVQRCIVGIGGEQPACPPTATPIPSPSTSTPTRTRTPTSMPTNTRLPTQTPGGSTATPEPSNTTTSTATPTQTPTATSTACPIQFTDVTQGSTFYPFVRCLACRGIINGYADGTFKPNNFVTRGQLSKIVSNAAGFNDPQTAQMFQDVPVGSTFQVYVGRLASRGYISGYACGGAGEPCVPPDNLPYFRPNNNATRGQISKIVANAAGFTEPHTEQTFQDVPPGSTFYDFIERLASRGVMGGYPCGGAGEPCVPPENRSYFRPNNNATRGQTSKIVANTFFPNCQTPAR